MSLLNQDDKTDGDYVLRTVPDFLGITTIEAETLSASNPQRQQSSLKLNTQIEQRLKNPLSSLI